MAENQTPSNPSPAPKLIEGEKGLAEVRGGSAWMWRRFRLSEGLPFIKLGGRFYYLLETVDAWLASRETSGAAAEEPEEIGVIRQVRA